MHCDGKASSERIWRGACVRRGGLRGNPGLSNKSGVIVGSLNCFHEPMTEVCKNAFYSGHRNPLRIPNCYFVTSPSIISVSHSVSLFGKVVRNMGIS